VLRWFLNSMLAATGQAVLILVVASMAAYALARMDFRGKNVIFGMIIATLFVPIFTLIIPNFLIVDRLGWLDTLWALIIPGAASAFGVFFLRQFFESLPRELEEAAVMEGANSWQVFIKVILPLSKPALATLAVISFLSNWNDFIWPIYILFSPENFTLPPGLGILQGAYTINYPVVMAGAALASIPALILFLIAQRYVIEGVSRSGLKG
jgi:multiple sugar transport system permease protein